MTKSGVLFTHGNIFLQ